jgi:hypothetical protein
MPFVIFVSGFCGMRTLPFQEPLQFGNDAEGFYMVCRLASDNEPERRVWKMTTRSERSRGEELYQASFQLPAEEGWTRVKVPFQDFCLVRGPRMVEGGSTLNTTGGIYQIGVALSKFQISRNMSEIENFRPGYFELQLEAIGVYSNSTESMQVAGLSTLSPEESKRKRPLIVKMLLPVSKIFFSEKSKSAAFCNESFKGTTRIIETKGDSLWYSKESPEPWNGALVAFLGWYCLGRLLSNGG